MRKVRLFVLSFYCLSPCFAQFTEVKPNGIPINNPGNFLEQEDGIYFTAKLYDRQDEAGVYKIDKATGSVKFLTDFVEKFEFFGNAEFLGEVEPWINFYGDQINISGLIGLGQNNDKFVIIGSDFHKIHLISGENSEFSGVSSSRSFSLPRPFTKDPNSGKLIYVDNYEFGQGFLQLSTYDIDAPHGERSQTLTNVEGWTSISNLYWHNGTLFFEATTLNQFRELWSIDSQGNLRGINYPFIAPQESQNLLFASAGEKLFILEPWNGNIYYLNYLLGDQIVGFELPVGWRIYGNFGVSSMFSFQGDIFIMRTVDSECVIDSGLGPEPTPCDEIAISAFNVEENNFQRDLLLGDYYIDSSLESELTPLGESATGKYLLGLGLRDWRRDLVLFPIRSFLLGLQQKNGEYSIENIDVTPREDLNFFRRTNHRIDYISSGSFDYVGALRMYTNQQNPVGIPNNIDISVNNPLCPGSDEKGSIDITNQTLWELIVTVTSPNGISTNFELDGRNADLSFNSFEINALDLGNYTISADMTANAREQFEISGLDPELLPKFLFSNPFQVTINNEDLITLIGKSVDRNQKFGFIEVSGSETYTVKVNNREYSYTFRDTGKQRLEVPLQRGRNRIEVASDKPCKGSISTAIDLNPVIIYPNPSATIAQLDILDKSENLEVILNNLNGTQVYYKKFNDASERIPIDVATLTPGVYYGLVIGQSFSYPFKLLVKK